MPVYSIPSTSFLERCSRTIYRRERLQASSVSEFTIKLAKSRGFVIVGLKNQSASTLANKLSSLLICMCLSTILVLLSFSSVLLMRLAALLWKIVSPLA